MPTPILVIFQNFLLFHNARYFSFIIKIVLIGLSFPKMQSIALCCASVHTRILSVGTVLTHKGSRSTTEKGHQLLLISKLQEYRIHGVSAPTHFGSFFFSYIFPIMISHYFSKSFLNRLPHCKLSCRVTTPQFSNQWLWECQRLYLPFRKPTS